MKRRRKGLRVDRAHRGETGTGQDREGRLVSYARNVGNVSFTWRDGGEYGRFINACRLAAWRLALERRGIVRERVVDIGCSYGSWADNWRQLGFREVVGLDPNPEAVDKARSVLDAVHCGFASDAAKWFADEGCVAANGVVVHILEEDETVRFLRDCAAVLGHRGYFLYTVVHAPYYYSTGRREWVGENSCVRTLEAHRGYAQEAGLELVDELGTFIDPWAMPDLEFLASEQSLRETSELYRPFVELGALLRERSLVPFSELLMVARRKADGQERG